VEGLLTASDEESPVRSILVKESMIPLTPDSEDMAAMFYFDNSVVGCNSHLVLLEKDEWLNGIVVENGERGVWRLWRHQARPFILQIGGILNNNHVE